MFTGGPRSPTVSLFCLSSSKKGFRSLWGPTLKEGMTTSRRREYREEGPVPGGLFPLLLVGSSQTWGGWSRPNGNRQRPWSSRSRNGKAGRNHSRSWTAGTPCLEPQYLRPVLYWSGSGTSGVLVYDPPGVRDPREYGDKVQGKY